MTAENPDGVSVVLLTMGDRSKPLRSAVESTRRLALAGAEDRAVEAVGEADLEVVIVWNGVPTPDDSPADVDVSCEENEGIPAGRNRGFNRCTNDIVVFLDDDAYFEDGQSLASIRGYFNDPSVGVVSFRIVDEEGETAQRHVPRLRGRGEQVGGEVTAFLGGACAISASAFRAAGGYAGGFFYAMEESDLALRIADRGYRMLYAPDIVVRHPRTEPTRHPAALTQTARNRVWLAHRSLPFVLAVAYNVVWLMISLIRTRGSLAAARAVLRGTVGGLRQPLGPRRPIRWSTVWRLTRLGRMPII